MRRCIGLDVHREFAQVAIWEDGVVWQAGRVQTTPEALRLFADSLGASDEVALEATGNTYAIARLLERHVGRVVVLQPAEDSGDRRGQGQDRQGRRGGVGGAAGGPLLALGVAARRPNARAAPSGHPPCAHCSAADPAEEPGAVDPPAATSSRAARPPTCSAARVGPGWPPRTSPQTSTRQSGHCCASWT